MIHMHYKSTNTHTHKHMYMHTSYLQEYARIAQEVSGKEGGKEFDAKIGAVFVVCAFVSIIRIIMITD